MIWVSREALPPDSMKPNDTRTIQEQLDEAKKLFPNGIIPEEKICDVVGIVMALVF